MSQISPPIRIVIAVAVIFMAAWLTVLKPKDAEPIPGPPDGNIATGQPAESAPGKMAEAAKGVVEAAAAKSKAALGEATGGSAGTATEPGTTSGSSGKATAVPVVNGEELAGVPKPVATAIADGKVLVLLFWNKDSADDRAVRAAVRKADRWNGRVHVGVAPIEKISDYGRIARGVDVQQSPTVIVVGRNLQATALVGYVDRQTIDQAVVDAMRASGGLFTSTYLRKVNDLCTSFGRSAWAVPQPNAVAEMPAYAKSQSKRISAFVADLGATRAPARYRAFARANAADFAALSTTYSDLSRSLRGNPSDAAIAGGVRTAIRAEGPIVKRIDARMDKHHVLSCGSNG